MNYYCSFDKNEFGEASLEDVKAIIRCKILGRVALSSGTNRKLQNIFNLAKFFKEMK
jgi:hypothetical protein